MDRRKFITAVGAAAVLPPVARAQEAGRIYRLDYSFLPRERLSRPFSMNSASTASWKVKTLA
jgi:hypothetical protein